MKENEEEIISTEKIILKGIEKYKTKSASKKFEENMYLNKIYEKLRNIIENEKLDINTIIFKDATASGLQNYGVLLGYQESKLKYLNIDNEDWCDTYQYVINKFLINSESKFKKRKYWKNTIMTIPYNARWISCFIKFLEAIKEDGIEYKILSKNEKEKIRNMHRDFYKKIKKEIKKEFYKNEKADFTIFIYNEWKTGSKKDYKINYNKGRDKYTNVIYNITRDEEATITALEANNMHYLDAKLVKHVLKFFDIISIHDCFGIRLCELHLVMDKINEYYSKIIEKETYSIHIII